MRWILLSTLIFAIGTAASTIRAGGIEVRAQRATDVSLKDAVDVTIASRNSWRNDRSYDAAWSVLRARNAPA